MGPEDRYARHRLIEGWSQERLRGAKVLVAGAGALGNEVVKLLALMGVGRIHIVDFDRVELSNLTRSVLFRESDIGRPKADVAAERAREINPDVEAIGLAGDLEYDLGLNLLRSMDLVIGCLDSLGARLALNRACRRAAVPWINGAIEVDFAAVSLFGPESDVCFECSMSPEMWDRHNERFSCTGLRAITPETPMPTTAVVASIAAACQVQEALALLHTRPAQQKSGLQFGQTLTMQLDPYHAEVFVMPPNPACLAHERYTPVQEAPASNLITARDLLALCGAPEGCVELGFDLLVEMRCSRCNAAESILRPAERCDDTLVVCPNCGEPSRSPETTSRIEADEPLALRPLADLTIPPQPILGIRDGDRRLFAALTGG